MTPRIAGVTPLDFAAKRDSDSASWTRADPTEALIERIARNTWLVTSPRARSGDRDRRQYAALPPERVRRAGLLEKRQRAERGRGRFYTCYRVTVGEVTPTGGVDELIDAEQEFLSVYDSSSRTECHPDDATA